MGSNTQNLTWQLLSGPSNDLQTQRIRNKKLMKNLFPESQVSALMPLPSPSISNSFCLTISLRLHHDASSSHSLCLCGFRSNLLKNISWTTFVSIVICSHPLPERASFQNADRSHWPHIAYKIIPTIEPGIAVLHEQCPSPVVLAFLPPGIFSSGTLPQYPTLKYLPYLCSCCLFPRSALNYL